MSFTSCWAIEDYSQAIQINPNWAEAYYNRGNTAI
ncbi:MAG TPA: tetratricopeptide repeat protein [Geminocystis sp. M7585_C2015_104]|nr:tetratricopeptide repeat protein [Geminocystis sp. M7585_C2015_104]